MIAQARVKALEEFPRWMLCCPKNLETSCAGEDITIDLSQQVSFAHMVCKFCGAFKRPESGAIRTALVVSEKYKGQRVPFDIIWIAEDAAGAQ